MAVSQRIGPVIVAMGESPYARQRPLPLGAVRLDDPIWAPRIAINHRETLPAVRAHLDSAGQITNFHRAIGTVDAPFTGLWFVDTDIYKWLEAASWVLATEPDPALEAEVDALIDLVGAAQQPDGYLDTYYPAPEVERRWTELPLTHELYCAGHLIQAAVAHHRATGKTTLLEIARRFADLICDTLGPAEEGKQPGTDGHPEVELALVELYRETGDRRYLDQAQYFIDVRGEGLAGGKPYMQDHVPFRELDEAVGHAVRLLYLAAGATDLLAETGEPALRETLDRIWHNMTTRRMYVSGGLGARHEGESFGDDYELPNTRAYTETCAAIASVMWNWRMLLLTGEARYADLMEWTLYNGLLPGVALDGRSFFYINPLADDGRHRRQEWFFCACCPPNVARTMPSVPGYVATVDADGIMLHLYAQGTVSAAIPDGPTVELRQETRYPWDGAISITVDAIDGPAAFALSVRLPAWCASDARVRVNGEDVPVTPPGSYLRLERTWTPGDAVQVDLPMPVQLVSAHPYLFEDAGRVAIVRGPILYTIEEADNPGHDPRDVVLPRQPEFTEEHRPGFLGGVTTLTFPATVQPPGDAWADRLYRIADSAGVPAGDQVTITAIPYFAWGNREPGAMETWLRRE